MAQVILSPHKNRKGFFVYIGGRSNASYIPIEVYMYLIDKGKLSVKTWLIDNGLVDADDFPKPEEE